MHNKSGRAAQARAWREQQHKQSSSTGMLIEATTQARAWRSQQQHDTMDAKASSGVRGRRTYERERERERAEHTPGREGSSRGHGGHGGTRRVNGGARPSLARPRQSRSTQHHHGGAHGGSISPGKPANSEIATDPVTLDTERGSGTSESHASSRSTPRSMGIVGRFDCTPWRGPRPPESVGIGRRRRRRRGSPEREGIRVHRVDAVERWSERPHGLVGPKWV